MRTRRALPSVSVTMRRLGPTVATTMLAVVLCGALAASAAAPGAATAFRLGAAPVAVALDGSDAWAVVETADGAAVWRLSPRSRRPLASYRIGPQGPDLGAVTAADGRVWAVAGDRIVRVTPAAPHRVRRARVPGVATAVSVGFGSVWVTVVGSQRNSLVRLDARTLELQATIPVEQPTAILAALGSVWVAGPSSLDRIDPRTNRLTPTTEPVNNPTALASDGREVWVADGRTALSVDRSGSPRTRIPLPFGTGSLAVTGRELWVTNNCGCPDGEVAAVDPVSARPVGIWRVGETPVAIAASGTAAWVASFGDRSLWHVTAP